MNLEACAAMAVSYSHRATPSSLIATPHCPRMHCACHPSCFPALPLCGAILQPLLLHCSTLPLALLPCTVPLRICTAPAKCPAFLQCNIPLNTYAAILPCTPHLYSCKWQMLRRKSRSRSSGQVRAWRSGNLGPTKGNRVKMRE